MSPACAPAASNTEFATSVRQIVKRDPRSIARHLALTGMASIQAKATTKLLAVPRVQVFVLHHIFDDERDGFRRLVQSLAEKHALVSYGEAVKLASAPTFENLPRPAIAFTFDDGYRNCLNAAEILNEFGVSACFFVCPWIVGETDFGRLARFCRDRLQIPMTVPFRGWDDLAKLRGQGHEIGGHTMTHANLAKLSANELTDEIGGSFDELRDRLDAPEHFAWTYGSYAHCSGAAVRAALGAGYKTIASGERGCHGLDRNPESMGKPLCVRRDHLLANWPVTHVKWLMARNVKMMTPMTGDCPPWWGV